MNPSKFKNGEIENLAELDHGRSTVDPPIEALIEPLEQLASTPLPCGLRRLQRKRVKMENGECYAMNIQQCSKQETQDDCEAFGRYVTAQLRQMSRMQKILAERLISEICFRGQIQTLQMDTTVTAHATVFQQHQYFPVSSTMSRFGNAADCAIVYSHGAQHQTQIPMDVTSAARRQNFIDMQQYSNNVPGSLDTTVKVSPTENV